MALLLLDGCVCNVGHHVARARSVWCTIVLGLSRLLGQVVGLCGHDLEPEAIPFDRTSRGPSDQLARIQQDRLVGLDDHWQHATTNLRSRCLSHVCTRTTMRACKAPLKVVVDGRERLIGWLVAAPSLSRAIPISWTWHTPSRSRCSLRQSNGVTDVHWSLAIEGTLLPSAMEYGIQPMIRTFGLAVQMPPSGMVMD